MGTTPNFGWEYPDDGSDSDVWGAILTAMFIAQDATVKDQIAALQTTVSQGWVTGDTKFALYVTAQTGWVRCDGTTIGNASSNATGRANADTATLFTVIWNETVNANCPIYDSAGLPSTRGLSAADDYAANKAISLADTRGRFIRDVDSGAGRDPARAPASYQADQFQGHEHTIALRQTSGGGTVAASSSGGTGFNDKTDGITAGLNGTPRYGDETRPVNVAFCLYMKL